MHRRREVWGGGGYGNLNLELFWVSFQMKFRTNTKPQGGLRYVEILLNIRSKYYRSISRDLEMFFLEPVLSVLNELNECFGMTS